MTARSGKTASAVLARAEQRVLCHRYDHALADLNLWPEARREDMKDEFAASIKDYNPEFVTWPAAKSRGRNGCRRAAARPHSRGGGPHMSIATSLLTPASQFR
ncbi:MAG TPA: hypothetical protein VIX37_04115 [Candidatus Sulfotelmatobacter sp.]